MNDELDLTAVSEGLTIAEQPELSGWKCHMYGSNPDGYGMVYYPTEGNVPNFFIRYMMKICLGCTWVKGEDEA
tara:strand:- start:55 stop:273 length:219 start_codon:yes stop_codon:yes gene_type:complete